MTTKKIVLMGDFEQRKQFMASLQKNAEDEVVIDNEPIKISNLALHAQDIQNLAKEAFAVIYFTSLNQKARKNLPLDHPGFIFYFEEDRDLLENKPIQFLKNLSEDIQKQLSSRKNNTMYFTRTPTPGMLMFTPKFDAVPMGGDAVEMSDLLSRKNGKSY